jgi:hypothetical protein
VCCTAAAAVRRARRRGDVDVPYAVPLVTAPGKRKVPIRRGFRHVGTRFARAPSARMAEPTEAPMKSILDPTFRYTNSANTDLRKTFARIRREQRLAQRRPEAGATNLVELKLRRAGAAS